MPPDYKDLPEPRTGQEAPKTKNSSIKSLLLKDDNIENDSITNNTDKKLEDFILSLSPAVARQTKSLLSSTFNKLPPKDRKDNENPADIIDRLELNPKQKTKKDVYDSADFNDIKGFYDNYIKDKPITITIVGNKDKIDMEKLSEYGQIVEVKTEDILN